MTILLRCRLCKGTGEIPNEQYRIAQELKSHDIKKYFHMPTEDDMTSNDSVFTDAYDSIPGKSPVPCLRGSRDGRLRRG